MNKREFLAGGALAALASSPAGWAARNDAKSRGPALLTLSGAIGRGNRGALDPALDQMLKKHGVKFDKAYTFDFAALSALPAATIKPTLEYDGKVHVLSGPLLTDVIRASGAQPGEDGKLLLRAVDGYAAALTWTDARRLGYIVATRLDGQPMALGGLGPLWAVFDADRHPDVMTKPLGERFVLCPWALYHIEIS